MARSAVAAFAVVAVLCFLGSQAARVRELGPLEMEMDGEENQLQVSATLTDSGPLTRADFNGEDPYETRVIQDDEFVGTPQTPTPQINARYHALEDGDAPVEVAAPVTSEEENVETVPRMLPDGRLVRIPVSPVSKAPANNNILETTPQASEDLSAPDAHPLDERVFSNLPSSVPSSLSQQRHTPVMGTGKPIFSYTEPQKSSDPLRPLFEDYGQGSPVSLELLSMAEGTGQAPGSSPSSSSLPASNTTTTHPQHPNNLKKVRVSSLVSGILSSVLSNVLTRGLHFESMVAE